MRSLNLVPILALAALGFALLGTSPAEADRPPAPGLPDFNRDRVEGTALTALQVAFRAERNAQLHYRLFARIAARENAREASRLFAAIAVAESIHAENHRREIERLGGRAEYEIESVVVGNTAFNLRTAIELEHLEHSVVYRERAKFAEMECDFEALASLTYARRAEETHEHMFRRALAHLEDAVRPTLLASLVPVSLPGERLPARPVAVICVGCGSAFECRPGHSCPNCGTSCSQMRCFGIVR